MIRKMTFRRRMMRRQRKMICYLSAIFVILIVYVFMFTENHKIAEEHYQPLSEKCASHAAGKLLKEMCVNVTKGIAFGTFCKEICDSRSVSIDSCIHHGKTYVLIGRYNNENIVIKKKEPHNLKLTFEIFEDRVKGNEDKPGVIQEAYMDSFRDEIKSVRGKDTLEIFNSNSVKIMDQIFGKPLSKFTVEDMRNSFYLIGQEELVVMALHQKLKSIPKLKGTCGTVYVMEGTTPLSQHFPELITSLNWTARVTLAKSFLDLLREFEKSDAGRLNHCDIQEANFGFSRNLQVKAIDTDLIFSMDRMNEVLVQPECQKDDECDFFDCLSKCDLKKNKCSSQMITNNLMVMCRDIFYPDWLSGLLSSKQPKHIKNKLVTLLKDCKSPTFGQYPMDHHNVKTIMENLERLLDLSLKPP